MNFFPQQGPVKQYILKTKKRRRVEEEKMGVKGMGLRIVDNRKRYLH